MLRGAVQITPCSVRYSVVTTDAGRAATITQGFREVGARGGDIGRVEAAVEEGIAAVRDAGSEVVDLFAAHELKGSRLASRLSVRARRMGLGDLRFSGTGSAIAAAFISGTAGLPPAVDGGCSGQAEELGCAVLGIGHHSVGLATGRPGDTPSWVGSRPVGVARLAERSRLSDPPEPAQLLAAGAAVERSLGGFSCPPFGILVSVSDFSSATRLVCGTERVGAGSLAETLDRVTGMTADEISARTDLGPLLAPLFPLALAIQRAAARTFGTELVPLDPDPADMGLALAGLSDVGV